VPDPLRGGRVGGARARRAAGGARGPGGRRRGGGRSRRGRPPISVEGRAVVVVDDGLATGLSDLAAVRALRKRGARRITVAVPVGSDESVAMLEGAADRVGWLSVPRRLYRVGLWHPPLSPLSHD